MRRSFVEGSFYAVMVGLAEMYFVPDAVRLGAGAVEVAWLVGLPLAFGALGAAVGLRALGWWGRPRPVVVFGVIAQALVLLGLAVAELRAWTTPSVLVVAACGYHFCAQLVAGPWSAWFGDIVPPRIRGRYFSGRTRAVHFTSFIALLAGGLCLQWLEPPIDSGRGGLGFAVLFLGAAVSRLMSAVLLATTHEGSKHSGGSSVPLPLRPRWRVPGDRLVVGAGVLYFAVYFGSPFFTPFMLEELRLDYAQYTLATAAMVACKVLSLRRWGRSVDRFGAVAVYRLAIVLLAAIPLPWLVVDGLAGVAAAQALSGFAWAAHEIAFFSLVLETTQSEARPRTYALQSMTTGIGQLLGSLAGGIALSSIAEPRAIFGLSSALRFAAAIGLAFVLAEVFRGARIGRRGLLLRVIGLRPSGGTVHRPVEVPSEDEVQPP